jgi:hypothetical protein
MKMRCTLFVAALFSAGYAIAQSNETYLCIADKATGFAYDPKNSQWDYAKFNVEDNKYTLSKKAGKWQWKKFGTTFEYDCQGDFNEAGFLDCSLLERVTINKQTLRYQTVYPFGYAVAKQGLANQAGNTPSIEIGRCSTM